MFYSLLSAVINEVLLLLLLLRVVTTHFEQITILFILSELFFSILVG